MVLECNIGKRVFYFFKTFLHDERDAIEIKRKKHFKSIIHDYLMQKG